MDEAQRAALTAITDDLIKMGRPGHDDRVTANHRLVLMQQLLRLIEYATPDVRHEIVTVFTDTLARQFNEK